MPVPFRDVVPSLLTVLLLLPIAVASFGYGIPIEVIVFSLLLAGYKGPQLAVKLRSQLLAGAPGEISGGANSVQVPSQVPGSAGDDKTAWRRQQAGKATPVAERPDPRSTLSLLKQKTPQLQWRSLINKFTPEKFSKLCEQLLETLPSASGGVAVSDHEFKRVLEDLLSLIFDASSRQHQYTEMYTDLVQKIIDFVAAQRQEFGSRACIWCKCQEVFDKNVLTPPDIPADLPEDERTDRKTKHKEKMVGIVKFGGDLVSRGLVPCDGVMQWIQTLLSEKSQELYSVDEDEPEVGAISKDKDASQREVQLELLCAILAGMGSSMNDDNTMSQDNRLVIEDVFTQLEHLSRDAARLSLRIRCLIRDVLDLRMAQWKEKEGKLKPGMLQPRQEESREGTHEVCNEARWFDPQLIESLQQVEHHLEVVDEKDVKLQRLHRLVNMYLVIQEVRVVVVAHTSNLRRISDFLNEALQEVSFCVVESGQTDIARKKALHDFESGKCGVAVIASEVSTRRDAEFSQPSRVLVNFDFPMTLPLYLYRLHKHTDAKSHVYTFFSSRTDIRHTAALASALDAARQKVPDGIRKLKDKLAANGASSASGCKGREKGASSARQASARADDMHDHRGHAREREQERAETCRSRVSEAPRRRHDAMEPQDAHENVRSRCSGETWQQSSSRSAGTGRGAGTSSRHGGGSGRGRGVHSIGEAGGRQLDAPRSEDVDLRRSTSARVSEAGVNVSLVPMNSDPGPQLRLRRAPTEGDNPGGQGDPGREPRIKILARGDAPAEQSKSQVDQTRRLDGGGRAAPAAQGTSTAKADAGVADKSRASAGTRRSRPDAGRS